MCKKPDKPGRQEVRQTKEIRKLWKKSCGQKELVSLKTTYDRVRRMIWFGLNEVKSN